MKADDKKFGLLQSRIEGNVLYNELGRSLYSSGASLYRIKPLAIVQPKSKEDVVETILFAREHKIQITARGGGTSRTGNEVGKGILIDYRKNLNQIIKFNPEEKWVRVQPGIVLADLNRQLKIHNLFFPIDPSTGDSATLGGMIANNSSGPHAVKFGTIRVHINSLELILSNGEIIQTGEKTLLHGIPANFLAPGSTEERIYKKIAQCIDTYEQYLEQERPFTSKNSCGYYIWDLLTENSLDLTPLLVGSEGTLALVSEATLKLSPLPGKALSGFVYFDDLGKVGEATQQILKEGATMVEIMEKHILDLARVQYPELAKYFPANTEALLFIEFQEKSNKILQEKFSKVKKRLFEDKKLAISMLQTQNAADTKTFARVRSISGPILTRMKGPKRPIAFIEDAAVHVSKLPEYINGLRNLFDKFNIKAAIYGHAGNGNLHTMAILDLKQQEDVTIMLKLSEALCDLVLSLNGTISGEHADGRVRTYYVQRQYPHLYQAMKEIKEIFDPDNLLNPGIIIAEDKNSLGENLKYGPEFHISSTESAFDKSTFQQQIENCSGCGKCASYCPIASSSLEEWTKGRGKITLLREIISGKLNPAILENPEFKKIMNSCINCKRCLTECPSGVDVPWLAMAGRANYVQKRGESLTNRVLTDTKKLCAIGSNLAPIANTATSIRPLRLGLEKSLGMDARRYLPQFHNRTLRKILKNRKKAEGIHEIVLFLGCYSNYNDPKGEGLAVLDVLEHNKVKIILPKFKCCGIARINAGAQGKIIDDIHYNINLLHKYTIKKIPIIFNEPSCTLAVKNEYPRIVKSEASRQIADNCYDIHQYLMKLHRRGKLRTDFKKINMSVGYHEPCHLRALGVRTEPIELMKMIPGVNVIKYSDKCCGMGGTYGLKSKNFDLSMQIGKRLFEEINSSHVNQLVTGCGACSMQIHQGTGQKSIHPLKLLAMAYKGETVGKETALNYKAVK